MFKVQNTRNGKFVKDAITCQVKTFDSAEAAEHMAACLHRSSILDATAWNSVRRTNYVVVAA